jgi:glycosyltransferase involved in cell wall biosynthesis
MGQQVYERELAFRARDALGSGWEVGRVEVRTLRTDRPGTARIPASLIGGGSASLRRAVGHYVYRGHDLVHRLDLRLPPAPRPEILTVLDLAPWRFSDEGPVVPDAAATARRASRVICPSRFSADEVAAVLGVDDASLAPLGVDRAFFGAGPLAEDRLAELGVRPPFVVHAAGCTQRKNLAGLAAAWARVHDARPEPTLVLVGSPDDRRDRLFGSLPRVVRVGRVDTPTVIGLMAASSGVVVPSTYEGFGLPALEGMAVGAPVVASARASLPEVVGDGGFLVEPDGASLAAGIETVLEGGSEVEAVAARGRVRAEAFTWDACAAAHSAVWQSVS